MLEFRILGPVGLWVGNSELPLNGTKQRTMLAALLLAGGRVLPDYQLGEMLWSKTPPETYQAQIYTYASRLRQHLDGRAEIVRKGTGYLMRTTAGRFDYHEFEMLSHAGRAALREGDYPYAAEVLRAALDLWHGPTLTGVTDQLAETAGPSMEEARMETLEYRIAADLALGRHEQLTPELVALVRARPLRERLRAQLMVALYMSDRQADAFEVYYVGQRHLEEELGVDPGLALRQAYQAILTGDLNSIWQEPFGAPAGHRAPGAPSSAPDRRTILPSHLTRRAPQSEIRLGPGTRLVIDERRLYRHP
ncbi:AfsR/SARP family transcriptional regulator [Streptomyces sp. NPDC002994]|uniref:AfsR/SARP family transcriptional regulator n=1 Tax=Streptomyces sp. NPDC002994 TaxID=3154441 RepID=UPI0033BA8145